MSERSIGSILDRFRKKGVKPEKAGADVKKSGSERKEPVLSEAESENLKGYLLQAKEKERAGDERGAYELYKRYMKEFVAITMRGEAGHDTLPPEYLEALSEIFKGEELDRVEMPKPEELTDEYFDKMYPVNQSDEATARGLVSSRPSWWNEKADTVVVGKAIEETWGQVYTRSMLAEARQFEGGIIFTESIQKPNYKDGTQQYGTAEGDDADKDPLLQVIQETFGRDANRFNLTWDQINNNLLPKIESRIIEIFKERKLAIPKFKVTLTPALATNLQMTALRPENSQTNTYEWTSTHLLKQDGTDSGRRLGVGRSERGGAGCVHNAHREYRWSDGGFRLSVVFEK